VLCVDVLRIVTATTIQNKSEHAIFGGKSDFNHNLVGIIIVFVQIESRELGFDSNVMTPLNFLEMFAWFFTTRNGLEKTNYYSFGSTRNLSKIKRKFLHGEVSVFPSN
jgi:hypothetical protein